MVFLRHFVEKTSTNCRKNAGWDRHDAPMRSELRAGAAAIAPMLAADGSDAIDTIVLACTHFPLLADELAAAMPRPVTFVDGGAGIARRIAFLTQGQDVTRDRPDVAVFTGAIGDGLDAALAHYGFDAIERL